MMITRTGLGYSFGYDFCSALVAPALGVRGYRWGSFLWLLYALIQTPWLPGLGPQGAAGRIATCSSMRVSLLGGSSAR